MRRRTPEELAAKLASLKVYASNFDAAESIAERYFHNLDGIHGLLQANACSWECEKCHRVVETPRSSPPRGACRTCGEIAWVKLVPDAPPPRTMETPQITAQEFTLDFEIALAGVFGRQAVDLILCDLHPKADGLCLHDCGSCRNHLHLAIKARARAWYNGTRPKMVQQRALDNGEKTA